MIFAINPINSNSSVSKVTNTTNALLQKYRQSQSEARVASVVVYQSLAYLTGSYDKGLTLTSLTDLQKTFEDENLDSTSAYELVGNMIENFDDLSSDGTSISETDFMSIVTYSAAREFAQSTQYKELNAVLKEIGQNVSSEIAAQYGVNTALTLAFMEFMNNVSEESLEQIISKLNSTKNSNATQETSSQNNPAAVDTASSRYVSNPVQDYRTVSRSQLRSPINIAV